MEIVSESDQNAPRAAAPTGERPRNELRIGQGKPGPGRPKGVPTKLTQTIKDAIEMACKPGQCHPQGLAGWLVERATGGVEDRKIFAGMVAKVIPAQLQANVQGGITVHLPWLTQRAVGRGSGTPTAQLEAVDAQVIELQREEGGDLRVVDPKHALEAPEPADSRPPTPHRPPGGGAS